MAHLLKSLKSGKLLWEETGVEESTLERNLKISLSAATAPPTPPRGLTITTNQSSPRLDSSPLILPGRSEGIRTYSALPGLKKIGPKFSLLSLATASPAAPLAAARTLRHSTTSHPVASPLPLEPLHPIPWCWSGRGRGSRSPNSRDAAQETLRGTGSQIRARAHG